jgi:thiosulfate/3-mercaptopyruvate sulfurtransferase
MSEELFVSADWLQHRLGEPNLSIVDAAWYLPAQGRDARKEYDAGHIPGAVFFDHDRIVDPASNLPHTLPAPGLFAQMVGAMGVSEKDMIIVYDGPGLFSAPRCRWMFRVMGARNVAILEGGLDEWKKGGRPLTSEVTVRAPTTFTENYDASSVVTLKAMRSVVANHSAQIADARPPGRVIGSDPEPRAGVRGGHMPTARNIPASMLSRDGKLLPADELKKQFEKAGVDLSQPVVTSCGSGVTAAIVSLALERLGKGSRLYDGSWTEWGGLTDTPVETGKS